MDTKFDVIPNGSLSDNERIEVDNTQAVHKRLFSLKKGESVIVKSIAEFGEWIPYAEVEGNMVLIDINDFKNMLNSKRKAEYEHQELEREYKALEKEYEKLKKKQRKHYFSYSMEEALVRQVIILADAVIDKKTNKEIEKSRGYSRSSISRVLSISVKAGMSKDDIDRCRVNDLNKLRKIYDRDEARRYIFSPFAVVEEWYDKKVKSVLEHHR